MRLAVISGQVTLNDVSVAVDVELCGSGREVCEAGLAGMETPPVAPIKKLVRRGIAFWPVPDRTYDPGDG